MNTTKNRILFVEPPFYRLYNNKHQFNRYPLSLGYLAATVKNKTQWDVMAYNADFYPHEGNLDVGYLVNVGFNNYLRNLKDLYAPIWKEVKDTILEYKPTAVGISCTSQNFKSASIVAGLVKEIAKDIIVVVGGPHPSMVGPDILNCSDIDIGVKGEGEETIVELLDAIAFRKGLDNIKGICYRKDGRVIENNPRDFIENLDSLCFPHEYAPQLLKDYNLYPQGAFRNIFATRGCPYDCSFCGSCKIWSHKVRFRSPGNVAEEICRLQKKGINRIRFDDDTFGINKGYINDLCRTILKYCPGLEWECEMHVKLVDEPTISIMKEAGCVFIQLGIESGNNEILKKIKKNITIQEALSACKIIKRAGIISQAFFMVGFPYETEKSLRDTVKAMKKAYCDYLVYSIFTPYPGTEAFEFCKKEGMIGNNYDVSLYNHQSPLNHFSVYINPEKFRHLASRIEKMVDRKNSFSMERERMLFNLRWRLAVIKKAYNKLGLIATIKKIFIALFVKIKNTFIKK